MADRIEWLTADDEAFMQQRLTWISGLRPAFNTRQQGVIIFTKKVKPDRWSNRTRIQHSLAIHMDAYGECVHSEDFPPGTHIRAVKLHAEAMLHKLRAMGHEIIAD